MCGTGGAISSEDIAYQGLRILTKLQNRGQDAAGFGTIDDGGIGRLVKEEGLVKEVFTPERQEELKGPVGVWHTRYRTIGGSGKADAQPHKTETPNSRYNIIGSQNGNIQNCPQLQTQLEERGWYFRSTNDGEIVTKTFAYFLGKQDHDDINEAIFEACGKTMDSLKGAYTAVMAIYDRKTKDHYLVAFTDPRKIRPGVVGKKNGMYAVASESNALELNGFQDIRDLRPGEAFIVKRKGLKTESRDLRQKGRRHCFFEHVYFGNPNHVGEGLEINDVRARLGMQLAEENMDLQGRIDTVMPMPFTAIPAASGFAETMRKPNRQGIVKDRYVGRIFIMPEHEERADAATQNIEVIVSIVEGKSVVEISAVNRLSRRHHLQ